MYKLPIRGHPITMLANEMDRMELNSPRMQKHNMMTFHTMRIVINMIDSPTLNDR